MRVQGIEFGLSFLDRVLEDGLPAERHQILDVRPQAFDAGSGRRRLLGDDIRSRVEDILVRLAHEAQELRSDKTDRKALAALLTEMAMRLTGEVGALASGDEVRV